MGFHKVEVDDEVFQYVKGHAEPLVDTFNSVLRRLLLASLIQKLTNPSRKLPAPFGRMVFCQTCLVKHLRL